MKNFLVSVLSALIIGFIVISLITIPILLYVATCSIMWGIIAMILWIFGLKPIAMELIGLIVLFIMATLGFNVFKNEIVDK